MIYIHVIHLVPKQLILPPMEKKIVMQRLLASSILLPQLLRYRLHNWQY